MEVLQNQFCVISNDDRYLYINNNGELSLDVVIDLDSVFDNISEAKALRDKALECDDLSYYKFFILKIKKRNHFII